MIGSLLIANRGEIACRIARTARRLGMRVIAVYSDADADAGHVAAADAAFRIGPAPARQSYLDIAAILDAVRRSGAEAVHPGYGFLSENADFAEACAAAGVIFVGPPASAIRAMGSKSAAKARMEEAGVPLVPGYHGADQDEGRLAAAAAAIGYPVLIKASAGGGGKGMRIVDSAEAFPAALAAAQREAASAFGDPSVLVEKYLTRPRHIEMQVFADGHGNVLHLFERDCSIQRRHQKVIEEAPAPGFPPERRAAMARAAIDAARAVGYVGAGTVEFIAEGDRFYFMEMNTRLQVEHPVTEAITGLDLVEWQLRVAAGERLPRAQADIDAAGHAIEARLYAEDPARGFLPQSGRLIQLALPAGEGIRVDAGARAGDLVSIHYDPMLAKLIAWGPTREVARRRLGAALAATRAAGIATNRALLQAIVGHPAFAAAELDTGFIERHRADLLPDAAPVPDRAVALATLALVLQERRRQGEAAAATADPASPWAAADGWRLNRIAFVDVSWRDGDRRVDVTVHFGAAGLEIRIDGATVHADGRLEPDGTLAAVLDGVRRRAAVAVQGDAWTLFEDGAEWRLALIDRLAATAGAAAGSGHLTAPMPGRIIAVRVAPGAEVKRGAALVLMEAMKMEHSIAAPADGRVASVHCAVGDTVAEGAELVVIEAETAP